MHIHIPPTPTLLVCVLEDTHIPKVWGLSSKANSLGALVSFVFCYIYLWLGVVEQGMASCIDVCY